MMDLMQTELNRNLLKYAVGRVIFCPVCKSVMDMRRAVNVSTKDASATVCAPCYDRLSEKGAWTADAEIVDGRKLWVRSEPVAKSEKELERDKKRRRCVLGRCTSKRCAKPGVYVFPRSVRDGRPSSTSEIGPGAPCPSCQRRLKRTTWDAYEKYRWAYGECPKWVKGAR